jgi:hypothetical protein
VLPIVLALLVSLLLNPLVRFLSGLRLPRAVAAGLVVLGLLGLLGAAPTGLPSRRATGWRGRRETWRASRGSCASS